MVKITALYVTPEAHTKLYVEFADPGCSGNNESSSVKISTHALADSQTATATVKIFRRETQKKSPPANQPRCLTLLRLWLLLQSGFMVEEGTVNREP